MCVKLSFRNLNLNPCIPHLTKTYTYEEIITSKVSSEMNIH